MIRVVYVFNEGSSETRGRPDSWILELNAVRQRGYEKLDERGDVDSVAGGERAVFLLLSADECWK